METIKAALRLFCSKEGSLFRYSLSYGMLMAVFPGIFLMVYLFQSPMLDVSKRLVLLYRFLPAELLEPFVEFLMQRDSMSFYSGIVSLGIAVFVASQSFYSFLLIHAEQEQYPIYGIVLRIKGMILFVCFLFVAMGGAVLLVFVPIRHVFLSWLAVFFFLVLFYKQLSFLHHHWTYGIRGAAFGATGLYVMGVLYVWIIRTFTSYSSIYGPLASVMILFLSIYVLSSIIYMGYCINVSSLSHTSRTYKKQPLMQWLQDWIKRIRLFH